MKTKKEAVTEVLKKNTDELTVVEISKQLHILRNTTAVALAELKGGGDTSPFNRKSKTKLLEW